jgi:hypothetical protein
MNVWIPETCTVSWKSRVFYHSMGLALAGGTPLFSVATFTVPQSSLLQPTDMYLDPNFGPLHSVLVRN